MQKPALYIKNAPVESPPVILITVRRGCLPLKCTFANVRRHE